MQRPDPVYFLPFIALTCFAFLFGLAVYDNRSAYEFVKDFQEMIATLVTGFLGFWGIIYTLTRNAELTRIQSHDEREHERQVLRRTVLGELMVILGRLQREQSHQAKVQSEGRGKYLPFDYAVSALVYNAITDKLGLLDVKQAQAVVRGYTEYLELTDLCRRCNAWEKEEFSGKAEAGRAYDIFYNNHSATLVLVERAIVLLG